MLLALFKLAAAQSTTTTSSMGAIGTSSTVAATQSSAIQTGAPCSPFQHTIALFNPEFFSLAATTKTITLDLNITYPCSLAPNCSTTANNLTILDYQTVLLPPTQPLKTYNLLTTCYQVNFTTQTLYYEVAIVNPTFVNYIQAEIRTITDCNPTQMNVSDLLVYSDGGVVSSMILISPTTPNDAGDTIFASSALGVPAGKFNGQMILDGNVWIKPAILNNVFGKRSSSISFNAVDPAANSVNGGNISYFILVINFVIEQKLCPFSAVSTAKLQSVNRTAALITSDLLVINEPHSLSAWDFEWTVPLLSAGRFEFYCPDKLCGGIGWKPVISSTFKQSWIIMGSFRWSPYNYTGNSFSIHFQAADIQSSLISVTMFVNITDLPYSNSTISALVAMPLPYSQSNSVCVPIRVTAQSTFQIAFGDSPNSTNWMDIYYMTPIRPLCVIVEPGTTATQFGDFSVTSKVSATIKISTGDIIDASLIPFWFKPLSFTGTSSTTGIMFDTFRVQSVSNTVGSYVGLILSLPQVAYTPNNITKLADLCIFRFDMNTKLMYSLNALSYTFASPMLKISLEIQSDGIYIFGSCPAVGNAISSPDIARQIAPGDYFTVYAGLGAQSFFVNYPGATGSSLQTTALKINVSSDLDVRLFVTPLPGSLPSPTAIKTVYLCYIGVDPQKIVPVDPKSPVVIVKNEGYNSMIRFSLSKTSADSNLAWGYHSSTGDNGLGISVGRSWNYSVNTTEYLDTTNFTSYIHNVKTFGMWALVGQQTGSALGNFMGLRIQTTLIVILALA